jgi:predicted ATP-grasp superfamily ATP-dependent carboligase
MALGTQVEESLKEAEASLRAALAFAARQEKPYVAKHIADMVMQIDNLISADKLIDKLENRMEGDSGSFGSFFS